MDENALYGIAQFIKYAPGAQCRNEYLLMNCDRTVNLPVCKNIYLMFGIFVVRHEKYLNMFYIDTRCYATPDIKIELHIMYYRRRYFFVFVFGNFSFLKSKTQTLLEGFSQLRNQKPNFFILSLLCIAEDWRGTRQDWRALCRTGDAKTGLAVH